MIYQHKIKPSAWGRGLHGFTLIELPVVRKCKRRAFTLIELLVVVAIIALLVAILLPALNQARGIAEQAVCGHNTHQHALAFVMYDQDYDGLPGFNRATGWDPGGSQSNVFWSIGPYLGYDGDDYCVGSPGGPLPECTWLDLEKAPAIWQCPSQPDWLMSYGFNRPFIGMLNTAVYGYPSGHKPFRIADVPRPAQTVIVADGGMPRPDYYALSIYTPFGSGGTSPDWDYDGDGLPASNDGKDTSTWCYDYYGPGGHWDTHYGGTPFECPYNGIGARHGDRLANCAFLDGHAGPMFIADLMDPDRRLWGEDVWE